MNARQTPFGVRIAPEAKMSSKPMPGEVKVRAPRDLGAAVARIARLNPTLTNRTERPTR